MTVDNFVEHQTIDEKKRANAGGYQPLLGWYKKHGYNVRRINKFCKNVLEEPVLGKTCRVEITHVVDSKLEREVNSEKKQMWAHRGQQAHHTKALQACRRRHDYC